MRVYLGWDPNETKAYQVAVDSLYKSSMLISERLEYSRLAAYGLINRQIDKRGQPYDLQSNAPCSTEFAASRFLVPSLCQSGWALFCDCDMVFMQDVKQMLEYADSSKAVIVVKHNHSGSGEKMGGLKQTAYSRKNWSSVMLFNCDHPANQRLTLNDISTRPGRDLHRFYWLHDSEIGEMPAKFNWLVNVQDKPKDPVIAHFTLGGPWIKGWTGQDNDDIWLKSARGIE